MRSYSGSYSGPLRNTKESTYLGQDDYKTTLTRTYELLVVMMERCPIIGDVVIKENLIVEVEDTEGIQFCLHVKK